MLMEAGIAPYGGRMSLFLKASWSHLGRKTAIPTEGSWNDLHLHVVTLSISPFFTWLVIVMKHWFS